MRRDPTHDHLRQRGRHLVEGCRALRPGGSGQPQRAGERATRGHPRLKFGTGFLGCRRGLQRWGHRGEHGRVEASVDVGRGSPAHDGAQQVGAHPEATRGQQMGQTLRALLEGAATRAPGLDARRGHDVRVGATGEEHSGLVVELTDGGHHVLPRTPPVRGPERAGPLGGLGPVPRAGVGVGLDERAAGQTHAAERGASRAVTEEDLRAVVAVPHEHDGRPGPGGADLAEAPVQPLAGEVLLLPPDRQQQAGRISGHGR